MACWEAEEAWDWEWFTWQKVPVSKPVFEESSPESQTRRLFFFLQAFASSVNNATMKERILPDPQGLWMCIPNTEIY